MISGLNRVLMATRDMAKAKTNTNNTLYSRVHEADGNFFESFTALSWRQENKRLRAHSDVSYYCFISDSFLHQSLF